MTPSISAVWDRSHQNIRWKTATVLFWAFCPLNLHFLSSQVEELRARDARDGLKIAQVLEGFISRKVVKQTVMTVVYGVTRYGGRLQIEKRLKEIENFPKVRQEWVRFSDLLVLLPQPPLKTFCGRTEQTLSWAAGRHHSEAESPSSERHILCFQLSTGSSQAEPLFGHKDSFAPGKFCRL